MTPNLLAALAVFAFVAAITPGPNNAMLLASGANFGLRRTLPHLAGVTLGFLVMMASVGLGLGALFSAYPVLHTVLKVVGGAYLLFLAFKIATATGLGSREGKGAPMTFGQAVAFQWVNPKAWAMSVGAMTAFAPREGYTVNVLVVAVVFGVVGFPCSTTWMATGAALRRVLERPGALRVFNLTMAALLVGSMYPLGVEAWRWAFG